MRKRRTRRIVAAQHSLDFQARPRRKMKKRRKLASRILPTGLLTLALAGAAFFVYWKLSGRVFDLRVGRAFEISRRVLKQTQRPEAEQLRYAAVIARKCVEKGLNPAVVSAIVVVESSGNPLTVSSSGDLGLMQVNARIHSPAFNFEERNLLNPEDNIEVGTTILRSMADRHGDGKAIQAYNGLLPEKREYASRVQAVLAKSGYTSEDEAVRSNLDLVSAFSDWIAAARASRGS